MARTVDHASEGRLILGVGAGRKYEKDYFEYRYEYGPPVQRLTDLRDALPRIKDRLNPLQH